MMIKNILKSFILIKWNWNNVFRVIELNISESCNLACNFCPRSNGYPNLKEYMSLETLDKILKSSQMIESDIVIRICGRGEPTMHPQFKEITQYLHDNKRDNHRTELITNGYNLIKHLDVIKLYNQVEIDIYSNEDDFFDVVSQTKNELKNKNYYFRDSDGIQKMVYHSQGLRYNDINFVTNRVGSVSDKFESKPDVTMPCSKPFEDVYIDINGEYVLCCHIWTKEFISTIHKESILDFYYTNPTYLKYKTVLYTNRDIDPCKNCDNSLRCNKEYIKELCENSNIE